ncbi:MAG: sel1 repeat family protein [Burkholderiaceae bacterium]|nr:sel1 repeat family protein [Burkholderiaceae bacterium]
MSGILKKRLCLTALFALMVQFACPAASAPSAGSAQPPSGHKPAKAPLRDQIQRWNQEGFDAYERDDMERALAAYGRAAHAGDASAQYNLAVIRLRDESRRPSLTRALALLRASAQAGFAPAQFMLASLHENGRFVARSLTAALAWNQRAADQGHVDAALALATQHYLGRGTPQDYAQAARWYERAADGGDVAAQYVLASMYATGLGVDTDLDAALRWYSAAGRQGDVAAQGQARALAERIARQSRPPSACRVSPPGPSRTAPRFPWPGLARVCRGLPTSFSARPAHSRSPRLG